MKIENTPMRTTSNAWPKPPLMCVWDCGRDWSGYDQPLHVGLDEASKRDLLEQADAWLGQCEGWANSTTQKYCLASKTPAQMRDVVERAKSTGYFQEVCGR